MPSAIKKTLLLKAETEELKQAIESIPDDVLNAAVTESLKKGGHGSGHRAGAVSLPMLRFAMDAATNPDVLDRIKHGLAHHISHYKSALANRDQFRASRHARFANRIKNLLSKVSEISRQDGGDNYINAQIPDPMYWEMHLHGGKRPTNTNLQKLNYGKSSARELRDYAGIDTSVKGAPVIRDQSLRPEAIGHKDFSHFSAKSVEHPKNPHSGKAYPYEDITINGEVLPIKHDLPMSESFEYHPMDYDPILTISEMRGQDITPEVSDWYDKKSEEHENSDLMHNFHANLAEHREKFKNTPIRKIPVHNEAKDFVPPAPKINAVEKLPAAAPAASRLPKKERIDRALNPHQNHPASPYVGAYKALLNASAFREIHKKNPQIRRDLDAEIDEIYKAHPDKDFSSKMQSPDFVNEIHSHPDIKAHRDIHQSKYGRSFDVRAPRLPKPTAAPASSPAPAKPKAGE